MAKYLLFPCYYFVGNTCTFRILFSQGINGLFTRNVFYPVSGIVQHCTNGDGVDNGQNGGLTHSVRYSDDNKKNNGHGMKNVTRKQTQHVS